MASRVEDASTSAGSRSRHSMLGALRLFPSFRSQRAIGRRVSAVTQETDRLSASLSSHEGSDLSDMQPGERSYKVWCTGS